MLAHCCLDFGDFVVLLKLEFILCVGTLADYTTLFGLVGLDITEIEATYYMGFVKVDFDAF